MSDEQAVITIKDGVGNDVVLSFRRHRSSTGDAGVDITMDRDMATKFCACLQGYLKGPPSYGDAFMHILSRWNLILGSLPDVSAWNRYAQWVRTQEHYSEYPWDMYAVKYWLHQGD
jgi:hypothetical protein